MRFVFLTLMCVMLACGTPLRRMPPSVTPGGQGIELQHMPVGPTSRERLHALPQVSAYRWSAPSTHFRGVTPAEDSAAASFAAHDLRTFGASVLRANGWTEANDSVPPQFELSIVSFERPVSEYTRVVSQGTTPTLRPQEWSQCRRLPPAQRANCVEPPPQSAQPTTRTETVRTVVPQRFVAFAIMRLSDSSTVWWITARREDLLIAQVRLLAAPPEP